MAGKARDFDLEEVVASVRKLVEEENEREAARLGRPIDKDRFLLTEALRVGKTTAANSEPSERVEAVDVAPGKGASKTAATEVDAEGETQPAERKSVKYVVRKDSKTNSPSEQPQKAPARDPQLDTASDSDVARDADTDRNDEDFSDHLASISPDLEKHLRSLIVSAVDDAFSQQQDDMVEVVAHRVSGLIKRRMQREFFALQRKLLEVLSEEDD